MRRSLSCIKRISRGRERVHGSAFELRPTAVGPDPNELIRIRDPPRGSRLVLRFQRPEPDSAFIAMYTISAFLRQIRPESTLSARRRPRPRSSHLGGDPPIPGGNQRDRWVRLLSLAEREGCAISCPWLISRKNSSNSRLSPNEKHHLATATEQIHPRGSRGTVAQRLHPNYRSRID